MEDMQAAFAQMGIAAQQLQGPMQTLAESLVSMGNQIHETFEKVLEQMNLETLDMADVNHELRAQIEKLRESAQREEDAMSPKTYAPGLVINAKYVVQQADIAGRWVILLCPRDGEIYEECRKAVISVLPGGSLVAGRTVKLPSGGRVSVVSTDVEPFNVPEGFEVHLSFVNFSQMKSSKKSREVMEMWRDRSVGFINPSDEIRV